MTKHYVFCFINKIVLVLRFYKKPPQYDGFLASKTRALYKYAVLFHFIMGMWMYSNSNIIQYEEDFEAEQIARENIATYDKLNLIEKIEQPHTLLFFIGALLFIFIYLFALFLSKFCCSNLKQYLNEEDYKNMNNIQLVDCKSYFTHE